MKILHISHRHHIAGGSDAVFMATTHLLESAGHQVVPFCIDHPANIPSEYERWFPAGADTRLPRLRDVPAYFWNRDAARKLADLIAVHGPFDVAHLHIYHGKHTPAILPVLRRARIPIVQSLHEYKLACPVYTMERHGKPCDACLPSPGLRPVRHRCKDGSVIRSAIMLAEWTSSRIAGDRRIPDQFICVSEFQKSVMMRAGIPARKLQVLHNFAVLAVTDTAPGDYFLYFGRIETLKGLGTLVEAARTTGLPVRIAGTGGWENDLTRRIRDLPNVRFEGFQSGADLQRLIDKARAVIVPSEWFENCPMSVIEAKARGRAVIGTRIGGIPELVRDGVDGSLVAPGRADTLAQAMTALTPAVAREMGTAALEDARQRFAPEAYLARLMGVYRSVMTQAGYESERADLHALS